MTGMNYTTRHDSSGFNIGSTIGIKSTGGTLSGANYNGANSYHHAFETLSTFAGGKPETVRGYYATNQSYSGVTTSAAFWANNQLSGSTNAYAYVADGDGVNNSFAAGAGQDSAWYYDGTDFVIDSSLVGSGTVKFNSANNWTANGTGTVTIDAKAPAGVGTATISKWFTVKDNAGTVYYIPAWT